MVEGADVSNSVAWQKMTLEKNNKNISLKLLRATNMEVLTLIQITFGMVTINLEEVELALDIYNLT